MGLVVFIIGNIGVAEVQSVDVKRPSSSPILGDDQIIFQ
jgi:hypothetical protein